MNRAIKFRFWSKLTNAWANGPFEHQQFGRFFEFDDTVREFYIVEQFTGLKDTAGKEIYEGDILKGFNSRCLYEVILNDEIDSYAQYFGFKLRVYKTDDGKPYLSSWKTEIKQKLTPDSPFLIAGNIHKNPDLLSS